MHVTIDFICMDLCEQQGTQSKQEMQNEKFLPTVGFEPGTFRLRRRHTQSTNCATRSNIHTRMFYLCFLPIIHDIHLVTTMVQWKYGSSFPFYIIAFYISFKASFIATDFFIYYNRDYLVIVLNFFYTLLIHVWLIRDWKRNLSLQ